MLSKLAPMAGGLVAGASLTVFAAVLWWPGVFLVWAVGGLAYDWARSREAR